LDAFFTDPSFQADATVLHRILPLRQALIETRKAHADRTELTPIVAGCLVIALSQHGEAGQWDELERWGRLLRELAESHRGHEEIQLRLANGAFNAINDYGRAERWDELERWGRLLRELAESHRGHEEIQLELANGAVNAINDYGRAERWDELERWGRLLRELAESHRGHEEIQLRLAKGAFNAINDYGRAERWDELERWGRLLRELAESHRGHEEIQLELAKGAVNAINYYGRAERWDELERWGRLLRELAESHRGHEEIQLRLAKGAVVVLVMHVDLGPASRDQWLDLLAVALSQSKPDASAFGTLVGFVLGLLTDERPIVRALLVRLTTYWPGFEVRDQTGSRPLVALVAELPNLDDVQRRELADLAEKQAQFVEECRVSLRGLQEGRSTDRDVAARLWQDRRFLPDRGQSLRGFLGNHLAGRTLPEEAR
jgi:hypothetical protein